MEMVKRWNCGMMEYWNNGVLDFYFYCNNSPPAFIVIKKMIYEQIENPDLSGD